jgi:replication initiation protein RepC
MPPPPTAKPFRSTTSFSTSAIFAAPTGQYRLIIDAADWLRHDLNVSKSLWGDACLVMGRELAAVALAIVSSKEAEHFRTSPGGYFHGMVAEAKAGELHLERTV